MDANSIKKLEQVDKRFIPLLEFVDKQLPIVVLCGHRNKIEQDAAFIKKASKLQWPKSKHNSLPSLAVDIAPYPINWKNESDFYYLGGFVKALAITMNIDIRWGGDWNRNHKPSDEKFRDLVHFEIIN